MYTSQSVQDNPSEGSVTLAVSEATITSISKAPIEQILKMDSPSKVQELAQDINLDKEVPGLKGVTVGSAELVNRAPEQVQPSDVSNQR